MPKAQEQENEVESGDEGIAVETLERGTTEQPTVTETQPTNTNGSRVYTQAEVDAMLGRARGQEKDKLYPEMEELKSAVKLLAEDLETRKKNEADALAKAEEERKARERDELSAKELLERQDAQWQEKFAGLETQMAQRDVLLRREAEFQELQATRERLLGTPLENGGSVRDTIAPQLLDYVGGNNVEEITQSIAMAQQKTADILAEVTAAQQRQRTQAKGASVTQPPVGPMETDTAYETLTPADIANMSMEDYAKNRQKLLAAASRAARPGANR